MSEPDQTPVDLDLLIRLVDALSERERTFVRLRAGLDDTESYRPRDLRRALGLKPSEVDRMDRIIRGKIGRAMADPRLDGWQCWDYIQAADLLRRANQAGKSRAADQTVVEPGPGPC